MPHAFCSAWGFCGVLFALLLYKEGRSVGSGRPELKHDILQHFSKAIYASACIDCLVASGGIDLRKPSIREHAPESL